MPLTKYKLGDLIELLENKNSDLIYGEDFVRGVNNNKKLMSTKADLNGRDLSKFQIVKPREFVFNHRTSRNGSKFSIAMNDEEDVVICTEDYVVFKIKEDCKKTLLEEWLYLYFNRPEFDRYVITNSWGSSTEFYNWEDICSIDLELPDIQTQKKYVAVYNAMLANQQSYEQSLDAILFTCDTYYDDIKKDNSVEIDCLIEIENTKNQDMRLDIGSLRGISDKCRFVDTTAKVDEASVDKYLIIKDNYFAVNFMCLGNWGKFYLAYNDSGEDYLVSPACSAFRIVDTTKLNPYYFLYLLHRDEFQRRCVFAGDGNTRGGINNDDFRSISIPLPTYDKQKIIAELFMSYEKRKDINEELKKHIKDISPILIKGSLEEAKKEA